MRHFNGTLAGRKLVPQILAQGALSVVDMLKAEVRKALLEELHARRWIEAKRIVLPHNGRQDFSKIREFEPASLFTTVQHELEALLAEMRADHHPPPFPDDFCFNEVRAQLYKAGSSGISPHRDKSNDRYLAAILVLEGRHNEGFCCCDDISGSGARMLRNDPGTLILMGMPGFGGNPDLWPFHFVTPTTERRTIFVLWHAQKT